MIASAELSVGDTHMTTTTTATTWCRAIRWGGDVDDPLNCGRWFHQYYTWCRPQNLQRWLESPAPTGVGGATHGVRYRRVEMVDVREVPVLDVGGMKVDQCPDNLQR